VQHPVQAGKRRDRIRGVPVLQKKKTAIPIPVIAITTTPP